MTGILAKISRDETAGPQPEKYPLLLPDVRKKTDLLAKTETPGPPRMKPKDLARLIPLLWKLSPAALVLLLFSAPVLLLSEDPIGKRLDLLRAAAPEAQQRGSQARRRDIDAFALTGAFAINRADAERASWSWARAKDLSADIWEAQLPGEGAYRGFYCGCTITRRGSSGGDVDLASCGYTARDSASRASRLEWEHVVPAADIGRNLSCWSQGARQCVDKAGRPFKGRSCCMIADPAFAMAATDPVNLIPAIGEVNGDRRDYGYGMIPGEARAYGQCDMEIDRERQIAEPPAERRGDVARIWAYMSTAYGITLPRDKAETYRDWILADPVSKEETRINRAISRAGHRANPFVLGNARQ